MVLPSASLVNKPINISLIIDPSQWPVARCGSNVSGSAPLPLLSILSLSSSAKEEVNPKGIEKDRNSKINKCNIFLIIVSP